MSKLTFAAGTKGAFRVKVLGTDPRDVNNLLLTGSGDEHELDLAKGDYTADVTNIGTGERQSFHFEVEDAVADRVIQIGVNGASHVGAWRSMATSPRPSVTLIKVSATSADRQITENSPNATVRRVRLRAKTEAGWRAFRGTALVNTDKPEALKIVRPGTWANSPTVRLDFTADGNIAAQCWLPLFSGGTVVKWRKENGALIDMMPCEPKSAAIVGGLSSSLRDEVGGILRWASGGTEVEALRTISQSRDDPWVAAAAGLLLVGAGQARQTGPWTLRLALRHPWLADLGVLAACWSAANQPKDEDGCLRLIDRARVEGHVYFWNTFAFGEQLLTALGSGSQSASLRTNARKELGRWKRLRSGAFRVGAFPVWDDQPQA